ncbi:hypothetical protein [Neolewinella persica]|uniref:hypothetical protein n=1 Tax=Neolewinella persica TaxID=70998 RepID=UPI000370533B|nr:hypothetical protein [Neolewinella persica]
MLTNYPDSLAQTLQQTFNWGEETVPLAAAAGRILAEPLLADHLQIAVDQAVDILISLAGRLSLYYFNSPEVPIVRSFVCSHI